MSRPPIGSTGTLAELQVEAGDVYQHFDGKRYQALWNNGELYNLDLLSGCWGVSVFESEQEYALISRANPDQPAHIVTHEGRDYDLTALETPFGLLPEPVKEALMDWPHGVEMMTYSGQMVEYSSPRMNGKRGAVWRAKPAPTETRVQCYRGEYGKPKEHGSCIKNLDGSIDWQSWEGDE